MRYLISVIIPVYNAEKTIRRCVDSLLVQERDDVEILLVNDGSKDGGPAICEEYAERHANVRLINKPNGGVSSARNAGLDAASGRYVLFVDSDDYAEPSLFASVDALLRESACDLIRFSYCRDDGKSIRKHAMAPFRSKNRGEALKKIVDDICSKLLNPPWAKLYRRDLIEEHGIRFPLGVSIAEDRAFNIRYSMYVEHYQITDRLAYYVNTENEQSLSRKKHPDLSEQFRIADDYLADAIREAEIPEKEKDQYRRAVNFGSCRTVYKRAKDLRRDGVGWFGRQKDLWKRCGEINRKHMRYPRTRYCRLITIPVRLRLTAVIDLIAKRLLK